MGVVYFSLSMGDGPIQTEILSHLTLHLIAIDRRIFLHLDLIHFPYYAFTIYMLINLFYNVFGGGRVVRWSWVNFQ